MNVILKIRGEIWADHTVNDTGSLQRRLAIGCEGVVDGIVDETVETISVVVGDGLDETVVSVGVVLSVGKPEMESIHKISQVRSNHTI